MFMRVCTGKFVLHTVQLLPKLVVRTLEHHKMFSLAENGEWQVGGRCWLKPDNNSFLCSTQYQCVGDLARWSSSACQSGGPILAQ